MVIYNTISGGHEMIFLYYSGCEPQEEPCVVEINQESDYEITYLEYNFKEFIEGIFVYKDECSIKTMLNM
ncbi:TPA: hypothetical protein KON73_001416 [Clostridioides difficile]|nr:hypothetical protein [Clostridioides difficile]